jgi:hypothetical protein
VIANRVKRSLYTIFHGLPPGAKKVVRFLAAPAYHTRIWSKDFLSRVGYYRYPCRTLFVAGLPKSGTTWVENFLYHLPGYNPRYLKGSPEALERQNLPSDAFDDFPKHAYSFVKFHLNPSEENLAVLKRNGVDRIVVMYRDPRDVVLSRYHHIREFPKLSNEIGLVEDYRALSREEGLHRAVEIVIDYFVPWIRGWRELIQRHPECKFLVMSYEQLHANPKAEFRRLMDFYGISMSDAEIEQVLIRIKTGRTSRFSPRGLVGKKSTFRKGNVGDWRTELSSAHKALFRDRAGDFLVEVGYEKDKNW